jgi:hypothetical protein
MQRHVSRLTSSRVTQSVDSFACSFVKTFVWFLICCATTPNAPPMWHDSRLTLCSVTLARVVLASCWFWLVHGGVAVQATGVQSAASVGGQGEAAVLPAPRDTAVGETWSAPSMAVAAVAVEAVEAVRHHPSSNRCSARSDPR